MSKVKQYIEEIKRLDRNSKLNGNRLGKSATTENLATGSRGYVGTYVSTTLEDLYGIDEQISQTSSTARVELRKTLRELKEKELLILKLREACHDLMLKYADAENTIDQLRFGTTGGTYSHGPGGNMLPMTKSRSAFCLAGAGTNSKPVKATIDKGVQYRQGETNTQEQGTSTSPIKSVSPPLVSIPVEEVEANMKDEYNSWSSFDVLDESCSNWMEKVQNWKTIESQFNISADADSGFRGSDINAGTPDAVAATSASAGGTKGHVVVPLGATTNSSSGGCSRKNANGGSGSIILAAKYLSRPSASILGPEQKYGHLVNSPFHHNHKIRLNTQGTNTEYLPQLGPLKVTSTTTNSFALGPQTSGNVFVSPSKYESKRRIKSHSFNDLQAVISNDNDVQREMPKSHVRSQETSPPRRFSLATTINNDDNLPLYYSASTTPSCNFKELDPLLDDATKLAKRVQHKSQKLARQLQQTLNQKNSNNKVQN